MVSSKHRPAQKIPLLQAILWIVFITVVVSGSSIAGFFYYQHIRAKRFHDARYRIAALVQSTPDKEGLKTAFLAELLDLSIDRPSNLYRMDAKKLVEKLTVCPVIKYAEVKKIPPGTISVDYSLRKPVAYLGDYTNTAIDIHGVLFPFKPFFTPKNLPEIFVGLCALEYSDDESASDLGSWGTPLQSPRALLALEILKFVNDNCCSETNHLRKIDTTKAYSLSYGQREVVIIMEEWVQFEKEGKLILALSPRTLRLSTEDYSSGLLNYLAMRDYLKQEEVKRCESLSGQVIKLTPVVIDFRLPQLAYLTY
jgi:hypothetical protein